MKRSSRVFPVELYCDCGQKAVYPFETQGAHDEFVKLWNKQHETHQRLSQADWLRTFGRKAK